MQTRRRVAPLANQRIPLFTQSVINKLHNSMVRLGSVLSVEEWIITTSSATNAASGSTSSTTAVITPTPNISGDIDDFFGNIFSALDIFAQVINLVYLVPPLPEKDAKFENLIFQMTPRLPNEALTQHFSPMQRSQWYKNMRAFRHCETHRKCIPFRTVMEHESMGTSSWPMVKAILLPDNPYRVRPTYQKMREMKFFGVNILQNTLNEMDQMYGIMETRIRAANHIPV